MSDVEEFDLHEKPATEPTARARNGRRWQRGPAAWVVAALALVGIGAANAERQLLAVGPGGIELGLLDANLHGPPTILWETDLGTGLPYVHHVTDTVAVVASNGLDDQQYIGTDLATGTELWRYVDIDSTCQMGANVVCVERPATPDAAIVTIDVTDGTRTTQNHAQAIGAAAVGSGLVVIEATDTPLEQVVLLDESGNERWRTEADVAETAPTTFDLRVLDDSLMVSYGRMTIDLASGAVADTVTWPIADGVTLTGTPAGLAVTTDDREVVLEQGETLMPYDDLLGGPIAVMQESDVEISAARRANGATLWVSEVDQCSASARLRGRLVVECWSGSVQLLQAVDLLSGETRWERAGDVVGASSDVLLVYDAAAEQLLGVDADDGHDLWSLSVALAPSFTGITALADGVVVSSGSTLLRLQWS